MRSFFTSLPIAVLAGLTSAHLLAAGDLPEPSQAAMAGLSAKDKAGTVAFVGDFNGDGFGDYAVSAPCFDVKDVAGTVLLRDAGRAVVISGKDGNALVTVVGAASKDNMGFSVAGNADINADGFADVVIGAPHADHWPHNEATIKDTGSVTVLFGRDDANLVPVRNQTLYGATKSLFGYAVALGDVDSNGDADIVVGSPRADDLRDPSRKLVDAGSVTVVNGSTLTAWKPSYYGATAKALAGSAVTVGDVNVNVADGDEIIVGAPYDDDIANRLKDAGSVTVYNLAAAEPVIPLVYGVMAKAYLGKALATGDVDDVQGDEILAGAPGEDLLEEVLEDDDWGAASLSDDEWGDDEPPVKMKRTADAGSVVVLDGNEGWEINKFYGSSKGAGMGNSVAAADIDGDGAAEIVAGSSKDDVYSDDDKKHVDAGIVSIWSVYDYEPFAAVLGEAAKDQLGASVSGGDVDGDGSDDLIIGIPGFNLPATDSAKVVKDVGAVSVHSGVLL